MINAGSKGWMRVLLAEFVYFCIGDYYMVSRDNDKSW